MFKVIKISYFHGGKLPKLGANPEVADGAEMPYSREKRDELVDWILVSGYNVMIVRSSDTLVLLIDDGRFRQR